MVWIYQPGLHDANAYSAERYFDSTIIGLLNKAAKDITVLPA